MGGLHDPHMGGLPRAVIDTVCPFSAIGPIPAGGVPALPGSLAGQLHASGPAQRRLLPLPGQARMPPVAG